IAPGRGRGPVGRCEGRRETVPPRTARQHLFSPREKRISHYYLLRERQAEKRSGPEVARVELRRSDETGRREPCATAFGGWVVLPEGDRRPGRCRGRAPGDPLGPARHTGQQE